VPGSSASGGYALALPAASPWLSRILRDLVLVVAPASAVEAAATAVGLGGAGAAALAVDARALALTRRALPSAAASPAASPTAAAAAAAAAGAASSREGVDVADVVARLGFSAVGGGGGGGAASPPLGASALGAPSVRARSGSTGAVRRRAGAAPHEREGGAAAMATAAGGAVALAPCTVAFADNLGGATLSAAERARLFSDVTGRRWRELLGATTGLVDATSIALFAAAAAERMPGATRFLPRRSLAAAGPSSSFNDALAAALASAGVAAPAGPHAAAPASTGSSSGGALLVKEPAGAALPPAAAKAGALAAAGARSALALLAALAARVGSGAAGALALEPYVFRPFRRARDALRRALAGFEPAAEAAAWRAAAAAAAADAAASAAGAAMLFVPPPSPLPLTLAEAVGAVETGGTGVATGLSNALAVLLLPRRAWAFLAARGGVPSSHGSSSGAGALRSARAALDASFLHALEGSSGAEGSADALRLSGLGIGATPAVRPASVGAAAAAATAANAAAANAAAPRSWQGTEAAERAATPDAAPAPLAPRAGGSGVYSLSAALADGAFILGCEEVGAASRRCAAAAAALFAPTRGGGDAEAASTTLALVRSPADETAALFADLRAVLAAVDLLTATALAGAVGQEDRSGHVAPTLPLIVYSLATAAVASAT
jgi:hypothetical protein